MNPVFCLKHQPYWETLTSKRVTWNWRNKQPQWVPLRRKTGARWPIICCTATLPSTKSFPIPTSAANREWACSRDGFLKSSSSYLQIGFKNALFDSSTLKWHVLGTWGGKEESSASVLDAEWFESAQILKSREVAGTLFRQLVLGEREECVGETSGRIRIQRCSELPLHPDFHRSFCWPWLVPLTSKNSKLAGYKIGKNRFSPGFRGSSTAACPS